MFLWVNQQHKPGPAFHECRLLKAKYDASSVILIMVITLQHHQQGSQEHHHHAEELAHKDPADHDDPNRWWMPTKSERVPCAGRSKRRRGGEAVWPPRLTCNAIVPLLDIIIIVVVVVNSLFMFHCPSKLSFYCNTIVSYHTLRLVSMNCGFWIGAAAVESTKLT